MEMVKLVYNDVFYEFYRSPNVIKWWN